MRQTDIEKNGPRCLIDSCGWIEYYAEGELAGDFSKYIEKANMLEYICPALVIYEVYKKIKVAVSEEEALKAIAAIKSNTTLVPITDSIALTAAELSISEKLPMADYSLIYATAKIFGVILITSDEHFEGKKDVMYLKKKGRTK